MDVVMSRDAGVHQAGQWVKEVSTGHDVEGRGTREAFAVCGVWKDETC